MSITDVILLFFLYSFLGWCIEVIFVTLNSHKVVNRGFLNGPVCPIYGCGMMLVVWLFKMVPNHFLPVFFLGALVCTLVELIGGWALDKIFHMRWWDYSNKKINLNGYICPEMSLVWGLAVTVAYLVIHPVILKIVLMLNVKVKIALVIVEVAIFAVDMAVTLKNLIGIRKDLGRLEKLAEQIRETGDVTKDILGATAIAASYKAAEARENIMESNAAIDLRNAMEDSAEKTKERAEASREKISDTLTGTKEKISDALEDSKIKMSDVRSRAREYNEKVRTAANDRNDKLKTAMDDYGEKIKEAKENRIVSREERNEKFKAAMEEYNEKIKENIEESKARRALRRKKMGELLDSYQNALDDIKKRDRFSLNSLPKIRVAGKSVEITTHFGDKLKEYRDRLKADEDTEENSTNSEKEGELDNENER